MEKVRELVRQNWRPAVATAAAIAAGYYGGPAAGELARQLFVALFGG